MGAPSIDCQYLVLPGNSLLRSLRMVLETEFCTDFYSPSADTGVVAASFMSFPVCQSYSFCHTLFDPSGR